MKAVIKHRTKVVHVCELAGRGPQEVKRSEEVREHAMCEMHIMKAVVSRKKKVPQSTYILLIIVLIGHVHGYSRWVSMMRFRYRSNCCFWKCFTIHLP